MVTVQCAPPFRYLALARYALMLVLVLLVVLIADTGSTQTCKSPNGKDEPTDALHDPTTKKRWAIVALAKPGKPEIQKRNRMILEKVKPYADKHNITVIIFGEKLFPTKTIRAWKQQFSGVAEVEYINTASKAFTNVKYGFGYHYMCKFFMIDIYDYLRDKYDYYLRCDTDCYLSSVGYDIMKWAEDNYVGYGFGARKLEAHKPTRDTLTPFSEKYISDCGITPTAPMDQPFSKCFNFYNNFHIGRVSFFTRPDVRHFLEAVNASGSVQAHRWGDSTVQAYAVRIFMNPKQIMQVPSFKYIHGSHSNAVVSTFGDGRETTVAQKLPMWKYSGPSSNGGVAAAEEG